MLEGYEVYVYDCEVFAHDWLFVFKGENGYTAFWNSPDELVEFVEAHEDALFVGYNSSHYDQYILKAIMAGAEPEEVKDVNDWIIGTDNLPWEHPVLEGFYCDFNDVDLMKDTQVGTSLKSIEGHTGIDIEESSVPFDIDRELTEDEREEVLHYCKHDVDATEQLMEMRTDYLLTKAKLGERAGLSVPRAMALTNAKLTAAVLGAERSEHDDERAYEYPENLLREYVPQEAFDFFDRIGDPDVPDEELWSSKLEIEVGGCPVTLGYGGIHGALPKWQGVSDSKMQLVNADVASYYPSLMIYNGYTSRNMPHPDVFKGIYEERLAAKAAGDKATANALKLIVNTTYGATLNQYNDLYDPLMARSVCVSGQLYLLELACHLVQEVEGLVLVQLNTDGILVMAPKSGKTDKAFMGIVGEWQERTHFTLEFDKVQRIWQKDVNNYAMRLADGHEKFKGSYVVRGASTVGAFSINNNATVVAEALRSYLLDGTPVAETVAACDDPLKFQLIAKAGHKYSEVYQLVSALESPDPDDPDDWVKEPVQKCNRVFATADGSLGRLYKVKVADGRVAKVESLPDHCLICNGEMPPIESIDKQWYIALAEKRAHDFEGEENMAEATETAAKPAAKRSTSKKAAKTVYQDLNVYQKLALARRMFLETNPKKSGVNDVQEYDYFELEDITPAQTRIFAEVGLFEQFTYEAPEVIGWSPANDEGVRTPVMSEALGISVVTNVDDPAQQVTFKLKWGQVPPIISKKTGKEVNMEIQRNGGEQTYMRRYLKMQVLDIVEHDAVDSSSREEVEKPEGEPKEKAPSAVKKPAPKRPATEAERKSAAKSVANADGAATSLQLRSLKTSMKKLKDEHGDEHPEIGQFIAELSASTDKLKHSAADESKPFTKAECEKAIQKLGEMREQIETEGE